MPENGNLIRAGLAGCGAISHAHAKAAGKTGAFKIVSCCDVIESKAADFAKKYKCASYYTDLKTMLEKEKLDAVILCTWPSQHLEQIETCLGLGMKNILCEKSLAMTGKEALSIWTRIKEEKAFLMEACMNRHHPAVLKLKSIVSSGRIGPVDSVRAVFSNFEPGGTDGGDWPARNGGGDWRLKKEAGGGIPYDWMSYTVNACNYFSGGLPVEVYASGSVNRKYGVIDRVYAMIKYDNGSVGFIENSKYAHFSEELQIACAKGRLTLPIAWGILGSVRITLQKRIKEGWPYIVKNKYRIGKNNSYVLQLRNFAGVIRGLEKPVMPLDQSVVNIYTIEVIVSSVLENKSVELKIPLLS